MTGPAELVFPGNVRLRTLASLEAAVASGTASGVGEPSLVPRTAVESGDCWTLKVESRDSHRQHWIPWGGIVQSPLLFVAVALITIHHSPQPFRSLLSGAALFLSVYP